MKNVLVIVVFIINCFVSFGQEPKKIVTLQDTIHLRGIVKYFDGTPAKNIYVRSRKHPTFIYSLTDSTGYFELKPCLPFDTLSVDYYPFKINNSRFVNFTVVKRDLELASEIVGKRIFREKQSVGYNLLQPENFNFHWYTHDLYYPSYPGGYQQLIKKLKALIKYPQKAIENNVSGEVTVRFTIDEKGNLINPVLITGIGFGCDEEVTNALLKSGKWNSGVRNTTYYAQNYIFRYVFKLED